MHDLAVTRDYEHSEIALRPTALHGASAPGSPYGYDNPCRPVRSTGSLGRHTHRTADFVKACNAYDAAACSFCSESEEAPSLDIHRNNQLSSAGTAAADSSYCVDAHFFPSASNKNSPAPTPSIAEAETILRYYGQRYYSPELGKWVSRDPIGERGGENLYAFVGNSPVLRLDPLGLIGGGFISKGPIYRPLPPTGGKPTAGMTEPVDDLNCKCKRKCSLLNGQTTFNLSCSLDLTVRIYVDPSASNPWGALVHEYKHENNYHTWYDSMRGWIASQEGSFPNENQCLAAETAVETQEGKSFKDYKYREEHHQPPNWAPGNPWYTP